jgi:catalase
MTWKGPNLPLPSDEKLIALGQDILKAFETAFGSHPGFRPAHAKGLLVAGTFTPATSAATLTRAPHIAGRPSTPVTVRFSNSTGLPTIPDPDPNANPRGCAVRFHLAERVHTDIIGHSARGFPARTGQDFLEFLRAAIASGPGQPSPTPVEKYVGTHPAALAFVQMPKPAPSSFAREAYFGVTAMRFINREGAGRYGRYRVIPEAGVETLDAAALQGKSPDFLFEELTGRLNSGPVAFRIEVELANDADVVDDATVQWPEDRPRADFGRIELNAVVPENAEEQRHIIFDPIPRVDGIEPSADPLLELRAAIYLLSGRRRREAAAS